jgi:hypothetical protein
VSTCSVQSHTFLNFLLLLFQRNNTQNTVQTIQNTVNTSTHITKTPTHHRTKHITKQVKTTTVQVTTTTSKPNALRKTLRDVSSILYCGVHSFYLVVCGKIKLILEQAMKAQGGVEV